MYNESTNVIGVGFKRSDLLGGVIVVDAQLEIIAAANDPVLPGNEATSANRDVGELESFDDGLRLI